MTVVDEATTRRLLAALRAWEEAAYRGDSNDDEHDAAYVLAHEVARLLGVEIDFSTEP